MYAYELQAHGMSQLGAARWMTLQPDDVPDADTPLVLMQIVVPIESLSGWRAWCTQLRKTHDNTRGIGFLAIWSVPILQSKGRQRSLNLHLVNVQMPISLRGQSVEEFERVFRNAGREHPS